MTNESTTAENTATVGGSRLERLVSDDEDDMYRMTDDGMYGKAVVPRHVFEKLNAEYFISHSDYNTKYMCANDEETEHLASLGIEASGVVCDWYKIVLDAYR